MTPKDAPATKRLRRRPLKSQGNSDFPPRILQAFPNFYFGDSGDFSGLRAEKFGKCDFADRLGYFSTSGAGSKWLSVTITHLVIFRKRLFGNLDRAQTGRDPARRGGSHQELVSMTCRKTPDGVMAGLVPAIHVLLPQRSSDRRVACASHLFKSLSWLTTYETHERRQLRSLFAWRSGAREEFEVKDAKHRLRRRPFGPSLSSNSSRA